MYVHVSPCQRFPLYIPAVAQRVSAVEVFAAFPVSVLLQEANAYKVVMYTHYIIR